MITLKTAIHDVNNQIVDASRNGQSVRKLISRYNWLTKKRLQLKKTTA